MLGSIAYALARARPPSLSFQRLRIRCHPGVSLVKGRPNEAALCKSHATRSVLSQGHDGEHGDDLDRDEDALNDARCPRLSATRPGRAITPGPRDLHSTRGVRQTPTRS